eukprot:CAMPEP_0177615364 /NCGR_PEP_ID=MMETSP0419_2-20121207/23387_1 /TAXON_ID=582737 /ORGANISM="Tetraselmis sp., Strain GSL018" /LENGTH=98 /DNA_ID=CAMNT_0019112959 /DNA_START=997 /DNA_END=1290 /DNA_ORIENTATION=+
MALRAETSSDHYLQLGALHFAEGRLPEALNAFTDGMGRKQRNATLGFSIACVLAAMRRRSHAIFMLKSVTGMQPDLEPATILLAKLEEERRRRAQGSP